MSEQTISTDMDDAAAWVARMDTDHWCEADEAELNAWLREDPCREGALLRAQALWTSLDSAPEAAVIDPDQRTPAKVSIFRRPSVIAGAMMALAASLAVVVMPSGVSVYGTEVGEIRQIPLEDGSSAAINTASRIAVDMKPDMRLVRLDSGEAWFKVAKNKGRPFVVQAGGVWVRAVGTAFSVRRHDKGAEILVTEGTVSAWSERNSGHKIYVSAGGRAFVGAGAQVQSARDTAAVDRQLAWRSGKIDLVNEPLSRAVAEFNRYNERKIVLSDENAAREQVDGVFRTDDPEGFAVAVHSLLGVPIDTRDPATIRLGTGRNKISGS